MRRHPPFPSIPDYSPVWTDGAEKPLHYRHTVTGEVIATPDYDAWTGAWSMIMPVEAWQTIVF